MNGPRFDGTTEDERTAMRDLRARFPRTFELISREIDRDIQRLAAKAAEMYWAGPFEGTRIVELGSGTKVEVRPGAVVVTS